MYTKAVVFDLDDTLAASKSPITAEMSELLGLLLDRYYVGIISGGRFEQFQAQLLANLRVAAPLLDRLHLMPTCGTRYYRYDQARQNWRQIYAEDLAAQDKALIAGVLESGARALGLWETQTWGEVIEDRGSQITFSALGQLAPVPAKDAWDPDVSKRRRLRDWVAARLPQFEVRVGGKSSVDVTRAGIDKAYGMRKLLDALQLGMDEVLFIGDRLEPGGNDYPVKAMGVEALAVDGYLETPEVIRGLLRGELHSDLRVPFAQQAGGGRLRA